jgi:hypothetical protein
VPLADDAIATIQSLYMIEKVIRGKTTGSA